MRTVRGYLAGAILFIVLPLYLLPVLYIWNSTSDLPPGFAVLVRVLAAWAMPFAILTVAWVVSPYKKNEKLPGDLLRRR